MSTETTPHLRGFQLMTPERRREIASKGGKSAHALGTAHQYTPEQAKAAGRKGGTTVSRDRAYMARIGRAGGKASGAKRCDRALVVG